MTGGATGKFNVQMTSKTTKKSTSSVHKRMSSVKGVIKQKPLPKKEKNRSSSLALDDMSKDWRAYFGGDELEEIYEQIEEGEDPNDFEDHISMSDDCASDDFLDEHDLYQKVYMRGNFMDQELLEVKKA